MKCQYTDYCGFIARHKIRVWHMGTPEDLSVCFTCKKEAAGDYPDNIEYLGPLPDEVSPADKK